MSKHTSVMLDEVITGLNIKENGIYVDATLGYAGHSSEILKRVKRGYLFAFDQDQKAIDYSNEKLSKIDNNFQLIHANFKNLKLELDHYKIMAIDGICFDLGVSSPQLDEAERGFSYHADALLDMRMDQSKNYSAYDIVNNSSLEELTSIIRNYGEEKYAFSIAKNIISARVKQPITTTFELVDIIKRSMPYKARENKHPAKKTFQAIRIAVNDELNILRDSLITAINMLKPGGRICVISFHSLEDRIVKRLFTELSTIDPIVKGLPNIPEEYQPILKLISKHQPTNAEIENNKRARSAVLRIAEKI